MFTCGLRKISLLSSSLTIFLSVSETAAAPQIERFLINQKYKEATDAEITRLRTSAKIEYLNAKTPEPTNIEKSENQSLKIFPETLGNIDNPSGTISEGVIERGRGESANSNC